jgi:hypothetical protein
VSYEPKLGEVVRGVGRSGKTYVGAFRQHSETTAGESTLSLQAGGGRAAGRVFVRTDSLEPETPDNPLHCELCGEPEDEETGQFLDAIGQRTVVAHSQCGSDAGYVLA